MKSIENVVKFMFSIYPNVNFISLNIDNYYDYDYENKEQPGILTEYWEGEYVLEGHIDKPIIVCLDGDYKYRNKDDEEIVFSFRFDGKEFSFNDKNIFVSKQECEWCLLWNRDGLMEDEQKTKILERYDKI